MRVLSVEGAKKPSRIFLNFHSEKANHTSEMDNAYL